MYKLNSVLQLIAYTMIYDEKTQQQLVTSEYDGEIPQSQNIY